LVFRPAYQAPCREMGVERFGLHKAAVETV
jgi:hypothetical protein